MYVVFFFFLTHIALIVPSSRFFFSFSLLTYMKMRLFPLTHPNWSELLSPHSYLTRVSSDLPCCSVRANYTEAIRTLSAHGPRRYRSLATAPGPFGSTESTSLIRSPPQLSASHEATSPAIYVCPSEEGKCENTCF